MAEQLPQTLTLQRFGFDSGQKLTLSGSTTEDQVDTIFNFYTAMQKLKANGQFVFDQQNGEPPSPRLAGNREEWSFSGMSAPAAIRLMGEALSAPDAIRGLPTTRNSLRASS